MDSQTEDAQHLKRNLKTERNTRAPLLHLKSQAPGRVANHVPRHQPDITLIADPLTGKRFPHVREKDTRRGIRLIM